MSFLSFFKSLGHGIETGLSVAAPVLGPITSLIPGAGPVVSTVLNAVVAAEQVAGSVSGSGAQKKAAAVNLVNAVHPGLDQTKLGDTIDGIVAALNALEAAFAKAPAPVPASPPAA